MAAIPPIWVISLARAAHRRDEIARALEALGLPFEFVTAVDGRGLAPAERRLYSHRRALFEMGRGLGSGMFGCSLSHVHVYERMVAEGVPIAVVLEDDVQPTAHLLAVLGAIDRFPPRWDVVTLHSLFPSSGPEPVDGAPIVDEHRLVRYRRIPFGTQGYVITLAAARRVLDVAYPIAFPPDELLFRRHPAGLTYYGIEPSVLVHRDVESEIHRQPEIVARPSWFVPPLEWAVVMAGKARFRARTARDRRRVARAATSTC